MTKRMREYVVHWLLLHGTDWVRYDEVNQVFYDNYHTQDKPNSGATEDVISVMLKGGYLTYLGNKNMISPAQWRLTEKALCKAKH
jgi:hypothetical protein